MEFSLISVQEYLKMYQKIAMKMCLRLFVSLLVLSLNGLESLPRIIYYILLWLRYELQDMIPASSIGMNPLHLLLEKDRFSFNFFQIMLSFLTVQPRRI